MEIDIGDNVLKTFDVYSTDSSKSTDVFLTL